MTATQVAEGSVLRDPERIESYLSAKGHELSPQALQFTPVADGASGVLHRFQRRGGFGRRPFPKAT